VTEREEARVRAHRGRRIAIAGAAFAGALALATAAAQTPEATPTAGVPAAPTAGTPDLEITDARVRHLQDLGLLVFELDVAGEAGATLPEAHGALDGAPVLGYVVPTNLAADAVGFHHDEGIVALAVTAHPDFDDTPLWDESADGDYANDGELWHSHWVLVGPDERVPGGLTVLEVAKADAARVLPPTAPGLPLYLDSPGFPVQIDEATVRVVVPAPRIAADPDFTFDAASTYLQVNTSDPARPMLGVYDVYGVLSGDLSLPFQVTPE
jgi:hypothetical protein